MDSPFDVVVITGLPLTIHARVDPWGTGSPRTWNAIAEGRTIPSGAFSSYRTRDTDRAFRASTRRPFVRPLGAAMVPIPTRRGRPAAAPADSNPVIGRTLLTVATLLNANGSRTFSSLREIYSPGRGRRKYSRLTLGLRSPAACCPRRAQSACDRSWSREGTRS